MSVYSHSEIQMDSGFVMVIDSVHCKNSKKLSGGIIILTATNHLVHTHPQTRIYKDKIS